MRDQVVHLLEEAGIQTRMLFAGNLTRHPCFEALEANAFRTAVPLTQTDRILENTFWVGVYPGLSVQAIEYMAAQIRNAVG